MAWTSGNGLMLAGTVLILVAVRAVNSFVVADDNHLVSGSSFDRTGRRLGPADGELFGTGSEEGDAKDQQESSMSNEAFFRRRYHKIPKGATEYSDPDQHYGQHYTPPDSHHQNRISWKGCDCRGVGAGTSCRIASPAPRGKYCYCTNIFIGTCHGYAYDCPADKLHTEECQGSCTNDKCCRNIPETWWKKPTCSARNRSTLN
ncbi:hypothetical protein BV898_13828 [Hypsibius exemplaris]|uniref:WAP domain-containing protein n=1 Tax=Hypsibius exemplaris TaxID=2072580 RepID=A0A1W0W9L2_HYPEX|nr:hypothetical protein BV898_13828 [Hypsibius exemplaris]